MITSLYAGLLGLIFLYLSILVIKVRVKEETALGSGSSRILEQRIRAHGNFAEYTPIILILLFALETANVNNLIIHSFGVLYVTGRLSHLYSIVFVEKYEGEKLTTTIKYRQIGMVCTFLSLITLSIANIITFLI
jgi:uncharacterized membrane protein YecN with MAPEG domain